MENLKPYRAIEAKSLEEFEDKLNELDNHGYVLLMSVAHREPEDFNIKCVTGIMKLDRNRQDQIAMGHTIDRMVDSSIRKTIERIESEKEDSE